MKRIALAAALLAAALSSCGATLRVSATAPNADNDGTCVAPVLVSVVASTPRVMHFAWTGPVAGEDSITTTAGTTVVFSRQVPSGTYTVRAWASDAGGAGCDTSITRLAKAPPHTPRVQ